MMPRRRFPRSPLFAALLLACLATARAQVLLPGVPDNAAPTANPLVDTAANPGKALLFDLEARFAHDTAQGGGKAFANWFASDGVTLANGQLAVVGQLAIAAQATWSPHNYRLSWTPTDAVMAPAGDMGYTWGHYEGRSTDPDGNERLVTGRYMTIWRRQPNGQWKVTLDASNEEPAGAGDCCRLPQH